MVFFPSDPSKLDVPPAPPARPTSQKAATMAVEASEGNIQNFIEFTGLGREQAAKYLKAKQNDLNQAIEAYFNGEDIDKAIQSTTWDESVWSAGKDGGEMDYNANLRPLTASAAPTRGPSPAPSYTQPTSKAEEDEQIRRAMAESSQAAGFASYQEQGVIEADGTEKKLQPATRDHYDDNEWAMVTVGSAQASEVVPDADLEMRKNQSGRPRFLKHLPNGEYLSALLTICHSIPMAREAFLLRRHIKDSYGGNADWWKGHPLVMPKIVSTEDGSLIDADRHRAEELTMEVQRLMAFLDASERSYAGVGALTQVDKIKLSSVALGELSTLFLDQWVDSADLQLGRGTQALPFIFQTVIRQATINDDGEVEQTDPISRNFIDIPVHIPEGSRRDLSQELDNLLWGVDNSCSATKNSCLEPVGDVIAIRVTQMNSSVNKELRLEVPSELYLDKYMLDNFEATVDLRKELAARKQRIKKIEEVENNLTKWQHPTKSKTVDARVMLKHTLGHYTGENRRKLEKEELNDQSQLPNGDTEHDVDASETRNNDIANKLERFMVSIDSSLAKLAAEKEKMRKTLADLSKTSIPSPEHLYTLRGVSTKPNVTYVLRPKEAEGQLIDMDERPEEDSTPEGWQWWRIDFDTTASGDANISKTKMADYDVLRAVELEHSSALLVYASVDAFEPQYSKYPLPEQLEAFVRKDNQYFLAEQKAAAHNERTVPITYNFPDDEDQNVNMEGHRRSEDSTAAQPDEEDYDSDRFAEHAGFGLGYDLKQGHRAAPEEDTPVHEIHLDDSSAQESGVELIEKKVNPAPVQMEGVVTQDQGIGGDGGVGGGGASHLEEVKKW